MSCLREVQTISKSPHILPMPSLTRLTTGGVLNPLKNTTNTSHNELLHQDPLQPPLEPRPGRVLPGATASLTCGLPGECDDVTGAAHAGCVLGAGQGDGVLAVPGRGSSVAIRTPGAQVFSALGPRSCTLCQTFPGPGPLKPTVGWSFARVAAMPVSSRALSASGLVVPHASHRLWVPARLRSGRSHQMRPCRHGLIGDHTVFHVVASCRANLAMVAPSKRNCRIAQRIARTPTRARGTHTEWFCSMKVAIWQVRSRHIQRRILPPEHCRNTAPGRVDHHHHAPVTVTVSKSPHNPGSQHSGHRTLCRAPERTHAERQKPDGNPPSRRADHTDHNDQATQSSSRERETPPKVLDNSKG